METYAQNNTSPKEGGQPLKDFQLTTDTENKSDFSFGKRIATYIESTIAAGIGNSYYWTRNNRFAINRSMANGKMDVYSRFSDKLQLNGKLNYVNLNWHAPNIVNTIISRLVGRWMTRREKISVKATDPLSVNDKKMGYELAEYVLYNRDLIAQREQASGIPEVPADQYIPEDKDDLDLWVAEYQRLPEEILFALGCNEVLAANGYFDVMKEKLLHDSAETGFVGTYTWMDEHGVIHVDWVQPENAIYSYSNFPDFRDTTWRGRVVSLKISEIRKKYGKEFGGTLSEEDLFQLAQGAKEYQLNDKLRWNQQWTLTILRPYDEWNVDVIEFELKTVDTDVYSMKVTNSGTLVVDKNPKKIQPKARKEEKDKWNIYRGVYVRTNGTLLEWGLKKNMIRPQDPKELGECEFSYSFYMYQSRDMRNLAVPEKIEEPVEQMILARLKIQQLVMKMKPIGSVINADALEALDLGLGDKATHPVLDAKKLYEQTGDLYYRGRDAEGNPIPVPIQELANSGFVAQLQGLIELYRYHYQVLKDELGEDPNLISAATQPRVAASNVETSQQEADFATDYMYKAYLEVMKETAKKISCLLKDSVTFGASTYRHIMKEEDVKDRVFNTRIDMLPTEMEIARLDAQINQAIASNPDFIIYADPFKIINMAREDVKLGYLYFRQAQKRMIKAQKEQAQQNAELNAKAQQEAVQMKAQSDMQISDMELRTKMELGRIEKEKITLTGIFQLINTIYAPQKSADGGLTAPQAQLPPEVQQLISLSINNIAIPLAMENQQMTQGVAQQSQQQPQQPEMEAA